MTFKSVTIAGKCMQIREHNKYTEAGRGYILRTIHTSHFDVLVIMLSFLGYKLQDETWRNFPTYKRKQQTAMYHDNLLGWVVTDEFLRELGVDI